VANKGPFLIDGAAAMRQAFTGLSRRRHFVKTRVVTLLVLAAAGCFCWCGCQSVSDVSLTGRLWQERDYVVPSPDPHLALAQTSQGILVQYDASYERDGDLRRRAYYLEPNLRRIATGQKPVFIDAAKAGTQTVIPIFPYFAANAPLPEMYAICSPNHSTFTVYRRGEVLGPCDLPVYKDQRETTAQMALTPLAAAGDASVVAAVAAYLWIESRGGAATISGPWPRNH
jgi:hypothetical protein